MTAVVVRPGTATGRLSAPASKSYTHRALVAGHLAHRSYRIRGPLDADDTRATARALATLGTTVRRTRDAWTLTPRASSRGSALPPIDCGESGTTLRFVSALASLQDRPVRLIGHGRLGDRPMAELRLALEHLGAQCRSTRRGHGLPLEVEGPVHGGRVRLRASESSQFASALLFILPTLDEDSRLTLVGPVVSRPYLDATLAVLRHHRVTVRSSDREFTIPGRQRYRGAVFDVPGDASSAAYLWAAAAVSGGIVRVEGIPASWPQADLAVLDLLERAGARVRRLGSGAEVRGETPRPFTVDLTDSPDLFPLAGVLAATTPGRSELRGAEQVAGKESDRRAETVRLARAFGASARPSLHRVVIEGARRPKAISVRGLRDHRLVMSAAVGALAAHGRSTIGESEAVRKSFPGFWEALEGLSDRGVR